MAYKTRRSKWPRKQRRKKFHQRRKQAKEKKDNYRVRIVNSNPCTLTKAQGFFFNEAETFLELREEKVSGRITPEGG